MPRGKYHDPETEHTAVKTTRSQETRLKDSQSSISVSSFLPRGLCSIVSKRIVRISGLIPAGNMNITPCWVTAGGAVKIIMISVHIVAGDAHLVPPIVGTPGTPPGL